MARIPCRHKYACALMGLSSTSVTRTRAHPGFFLFVNLMRRSGASPVAVLKLGMLAWDQPQFVKYVKRQVSKLALRSMLIVADQSQTGVVNKLGQRSIQPCSVCPTSTELPKAKTTSE